MKKIFFFNLLCIVSFAAHAQNSQEIKDAPKNDEKTHWRITMHLGKSIINVASLNQYLRDSGLQPLNGSAFKGLISLSLGDEKDKFTNMMEVGYVGQVENTDASSTSMQSVLLSVNLGYKLLDKPKHTITPILGITNSEFTRLNIRNGTPVSATFGSQLTSPNSTSTQLTYRVRTFVHTGLEYKFKNRLLDVGIRIGHYFKTSKGKWFNQVPNATLTDAPIINPLGTYFTFLVAM